jgi:hypothetical protein
MRDQAHAVNGLAQLGYEVNALKVSKLQFFSYRRNPRLSVRLQPNDGQPSRLTLRRKIQHG